MRIAYFPGCSLHGTARDYGESVVACCRALGVELVEVPDWVCCGASTAPTLSHRLAVGLGAINLAQAAQVGDAVLAPCAACYNRLKMAGCAAQTEPKLLDGLEGVEAEKVAAVRVYSMPEFLVERYGLDALREKVTRPLAGLHPAAYYGCLLVRPPDVCQFDDPEQPHSMDDILRALGGEPVVWYNKTDCCGGMLSPTRTEVVSALTQRLVERARQAGADCLVTACPMCHMNVESRQAACRDGRLPTFYLTDMVGLALGLRPEELGLKRHLVDTLPLLQAAGLA